MAASMPVPKGSRVRLSPPFSAVGAELKPRRVDRRACFSEGARRDPLGDFWRSGGENGRATAPPHFRREGGARRRPHRNPLFLRGGRN